MEFYFEIQHRTCPFLTLAVFTNPSRSQSNLLVERTRRISPSLRARLSFSYLCATTGCSAGTLAERRAPWPAWW